MIAKISVSLLLTLMMPFYSQAQTFCDSEVEALGTRGLAGEILVRATNLQDGSQVDHTLSFVIKPDIRRIDKCLPGQMNLRLGSKGVLLIGERQIPVDIAAISGTSKPSHYFAFRDNADPNIVKRGFWLVVPEISGIFMDLSTLNSILIRALGYAELNFSAARDGDRYRFFTFQDGYESRFFPFETSFNLPVITRGTKEGISYEVSIMKNTILGLAPLPEAL